MPNSILLVGFEKNIASSLTSLFPEVTIKTVPSDFSYDDFSCYCAGTHCIFINGEPSVFLNIIKGLSYIGYPGNGMLSYYGETILILDLIWLLFVGRQIFVFGLPKALCLNSLKEIADITGTKLQTQPSMDSVTLDIKIEHKDYLAGFFFAQLFSFLPESFTHKEPQYGTIKNDECFKRSTVLLNSVLLKLQAIKPDHDLSLQNLRCLIDDISEIARQVKDEAEDIDLQVFGRERFNGVEEVKLDNNHPFTQLYPEYIDYHLHWWLRRTPSILKPIMPHEYLTERRDRPVRQLINKLHGRRSKVFLLPPPENMEDVLMPISAVLDDLTRKSLGTESVSDLRELYRRRFSNKQFPIIGDSTAMQLLYRQILPVLNDKAGHVLIMGEAGTGKELVANIIKEWQEDTLQSVNCSHLTANIAHSNLFGYVDGAFTGAKKGGKPGYIYEQGRGSLFLDEIQALPEEVMPMLLRYLEGGEFVRMGDTKVRKSSIRIIAASNDDQMLYGKFVSSGFISRFRYVIRVPSLKYRRDDIKSLVQHFVEKAKADLKLPCSATISKQQIEVLKNTDWRHSNVRGLKNSVYNLLARGAYSVISSGKELQSTADVVVHDVHPAEPDEKENKAGCPTKISDDMLREMLVEASDAKELQAKLRSYQVKNKVKGEQMPYPTIQAMTRRINESENRDELKKLFKKFVHEYPKKRRAKQKNISTRSKK